MGSPARSTAIPAEAIGGLAVGVSPLEMADAYASFADGGVHHEPARSRRSSSAETATGKVDDFEQPEGNRVLTDGIAYEVTEILKTVLDSGTATGHDLPLPRGG